MPARFDINLSNLKHNVELYKTKIMEGQELLVMVKADAYGAGILPVTKFLEENGIKHFGVAYLTEAIALRNSGVKAEITVFSGLVPEEYETAINVDAIYSVSSYDTLETLNEAAKKHNKNMKVQIALDTGMTRLGFNEKEVEELAVKLLQLKNIIVHGVYSHFSQADTSEQFTLKQIETFDRAVETLKKYDIAPKHVHICNSAGILKYNSSKYNLVRLGIGAYGYPPAENMRDELELKGIFKLVAPICNIKYVEPNREVSYGGTYVTNKDTKIAVLQIGYADGLTRTLSNKYTVLASGKNVNIIGNICMDTCMIDVTDVDVKIGDEIVIFDYTDNKVDEIAKLTGTIVYEIITNIGKRVDRNYIIE